MDIYSTEQKIAIGKAAIAKMNRELVRILKLKWPDAPEGMTDLPLFPYQMEILNHFFKKDNFARYVVLKCGRKFSKTHCTNYFQAYEGLSFKDYDIVPDPTIYYVMPTATQANEVNWRRLVKFFPEFLDCSSDVDLMKFPELKGMGKIKIIKNARKSELEILLFNDVRIKMVGSTGLSKEALRGGEPIACVYDEIKDHHPDFHVAMRPNFGPHRTKVLCVGSPAFLDGLERGDNEAYQSILNECEIRAKKFGDAFIYNKSGGENPLPNVRQEFELEREMAYSSGDPAKIAQFQCEYEGKDVYSNKTSTMVTISEDDLIDPSRLECEVRNNASEFTFGAMFDAGGSTRWASLIYAINKTSGSLYILDAAILSGRSKEDVEYFSHTKFFGLVMNKIAGLNMPVPLLDWTFHKDSDSSAFEHNVGNSDEYKGVIVLPVNKNKFEKMEGFSLIKDLKDNGRLKLSEKATVIASEFKAMVLDSNGYPKKRFDDATDCLRYILFMYDYLLTVDTRVSMPPESTGHYFQDLIRARRVSERSSGRVSAVYLNNDDYDIIED
jgi:hypothetical protein